MIATISEHVGRFVAMKRKLGYRFNSSAELLHSFGRFADARDERFLRSATAIDWASGSTTTPPPQRVKRLHALHLFACWLHAEDARHEVPPRDALGRAVRRRPKPHLVSVADIRRLLAAALSMGPGGTIVPLTWHHLFGLIAATGLRIGEALALQLHDITPDGLIVRDTKFGKTRMVALHPSTREALDRYLRARRKETTQDRHLFVIATGRPPARNTASIVFRALAERVGIRQPGVTPGPTLHSLRHSFAVRSLENLQPAENPSRHMLALATYLGHSEVSSTYWYLESTPLLLHGIAEAAEQAHAKGGCDE